MATMRHLEILALFVGICTSYSEQVPAKVTVIKPNCNNEAILPCAAISYSRAYTSIIWYKVIQSKDHGIIRRPNGSQRPELYPKYANVASLTEEFSLVLKNITLKDAGIYKCQIFAKVGETNNDTLVLLNVSECVSKTTPTPVLTTEFAYQSTTYGWNSTKNGFPGAVQPVEVTTLWTFVGFITIGLVKVLLCALCVWGVVRFKKHRRKSIWS